MNAMAPQGGRSLEHWPEYLCEALELCLFMISAGVFTILLEHPASPVFSAIPDPFLRRMLIRMAMGGTAIAIVFSPLGKRSGAHFNPAVTLTFWRLGKVKGIGTRSFTSSRNSLVGFWASRSWRCSSRSRWLIRPSISSPLCQDHTAWGWLLSPSW